jgi:hypothetical protein
MMAIAAVQRATPSRSREGHDVQHDATSSTLADMYPPVGFIPDTTLTPLSPAGEGIIPSLPNNKGPEMSVSFKDSLADVSDGDIMDLPKIPAESHDETQPPKRARAFQFPYKPCASRTTIRTAPSTAAKKQEGG